MQSLCDIIGTGEFQFHRHEWRFVSREAKNFITKLLVVDINIRMDVNTALQHPWVQYNII